MVNMAVFGFALLPLINVCVCVCVFVKPRIVSFGDSELFYIHIRKYAVCHARNTTAVVQLLSLAIQWKLEICSLVASLFAYLLLLETKPMYTGSTLVVVILVCAFCMVCMYMYT